MRLGVRALVVAGLLTLVSAGRVSAQVTNTKALVETVTLSGWTSGTSVNATQTIYGVGDAGFGEVLVYLTQTTTITGGAITFEDSYDGGTTWTTVPADAVLDPTSTTYAQVSLPYTLVASTNKPFLILGKGWSGLRIKLSTAITGSATVTPNVMFVPYETAGEVVALSPTAANFNVTVATLPPAAGALHAGGTSAMTGTTSTQVIAAVSSNNLYIASCSVNNTHASVDTLVDLQDGSGGTVLWTFTAPHAYGGEAHTFNPPLKVPTQGNALFAADETTGASVKVFCQGFSSTVSY